MPRDANLILPLQGRWQGAALTEGYSPLDRMTPLHHSLREWSPSPSRGGMVNP
jgi:flagellar P-ring protein precursor FlgI